MRHLSVHPLPTALPPEQALIRLSRYERPFLLDGAVDADGVGRMSYAGCDPLARYRVAELPRPSPGVPGEKPTPAPLMDMQRHLEDLHPLVAVGVLGYDLGRAIENFRSYHREDDIGIAPIDLAAFDALYRHDRRTGESVILATDAQAAARLRAKLMRDAPPPRSAAPGRARFTVSAREHGKSVERARDYIAAGDCYQVNLCRRLVAEVREEAALPLYLRLRETAPAPLGAYLALDPTPSGHAPLILSNTPERLLRADLVQGSLDTRPIKGTRRRDRDPVLDRALLSELRASEKEQAEHLMIVDLLRNDLGRIARTGSVRVEGYARPLSLPTVHHLVSTVRAEARAGLGLGDLLAAIFPGGSVTGAPRLRAMEIIDELEPVARGPFYGALGWMTRDECELALAIRTAVVRGGELVLSVGGGVVFDSTPEGETEETEVKAAAFLRALG